MEIKVGNDVCDDQLVLQLNVNEDGEVCEIKYRAYGCATSIATGNIFCEFVKGKSLELISATDQNQRNKMLGELDPSQHHCLDILNNIFNRVGTFCEA